MGPNSNSRKILRDLTKASLSDAGLSIVAVFIMMLLFGMELSSYLAVDTTATVVVDKSVDGDFLHIDFNIRSCRTVQQGSL
ncbi:protein disulfide-isomerase 5-3-like [Raphanus sativus]|uniref:Protein disulfide-isomerase 5-3-like n=1 Tax=Raphanus sativus TaxID=3726 RepID=A0A6J0NCN7_RAPSA|nr:protein disulfide-isomerase 5-3-like [Raphanus sativus]